VGVGAGWRIQRLKQKLVEGGPVKEENRGDKGGWECVSLRG